MNILLLMLIPILIIICCLGGSFSFFIASALTFKGKIIYTCIITAAGIIAVILQTIFYFSL